MRAIPNYYSSGSIETQTADFFPNLLCSNEIFYKNPVASNSFFPN